MAQQLKAGNTPAENQSLVLSTNTSWAHNFLKLRLPVI